MIPVDGFVHFPLAGDEWEKVGGGLQGRERRFLLMGAHPAGMESEHFDAFGTECVLQDARLHVECCFGHAVGIGAFAFAVGDGTGFRGDVG